MNIHLKIKECVNKKGAEIIVSNTLIGMLDDEQVFDEIETLPYKKILRNIIKEGYTRRLLNLGGYTPEVNFLASQYAQENFMQEAPIQYVLDCLAYGLGWIDQEPALQASRPKVDKAREEAEEKIRKGKEFYKSKEYDKAFLYLKEGLQFVSDVEAEFILGSLYETGKGVSRNGREAAKWYRIAAEKGYANAQYALGGMYDSNNIFNIGGLVSDDVEAVKWYRKAAEQGHASAQYALGGMYDKGTGVVKNVSEAMIWYKRAADRGLANAQCFLGLHYFNERNYAEAVNWLRKAAKQGHGSATSILKSLAMQGLPAAQACFDSNGNLK